VLDTQLQPGDIVVSYRNYYQDLPVYLQPSTPLIVVDDWDAPEIMAEDNWRREFFLGLRDQPEARRWLIDEARFAELLATHPHTFVLVRSRDEAYLAKRYGLRTIAHEKKNALMIQTSIDSVGAIQSGRSQLLRQQYLGVRFNGQPRNGG
jgi:hypothetical protein